MTGNGPGDAGVRDAVSAPRATSELPAADSAPLTVGVVVPVYRCADYVRQCLESVLAQTYPVTEIVLVDDRGGDDSVQRAEETLNGHQRDFLLITQPRNGGLGRARNTGLCALTTDLVWFLDSDDTAEPEFVATLVGALREGDADFAVCRTIRVDDSGAELGLDEAQAPAAVVPGSRYAHELLTGRAKSYACTKIYRREILGVAPWPEGQAYEDQVPGIDLALKADRVAMVDAPLYRYLYREGSISTALRPSTFDLFDVGTQVRGMVDTLGPDWRRESVAYWYRQVLTSVAHVAMRSDHASSRRPELYDQAIDRVRAGIAVRDLPTLIRTGNYRSVVFALLMILAPDIYSAILRRR